MLFKATVKGAFYVPVECRIQEVDHSAVAKTRKGAINRVLSESGTLKLHPLKRTVTVSPV